MPTAPSRLKQARKKGEVLLLQVGFLVVPRLPRGALLGLSRFAGWLAYHLARELRRVGEANLELAFSGELSGADTRRILRGSFRTFALAILDVFWFTRNTKARLSAATVLDDSVAPTVFQHRAQICVTAHMGNWELLSHVMAWKGYPMLSVIAPSANPGVEQYFMRVREMMGQQVVFREGAVRHLLRTLKNGGKVGLLLDQNTKPVEGGTFVEFFGLPVPVSLAAASLAVRTHAEIVVGLALLQPDGTYRVTTVGGPIPPPVKDEVNEAHQLNRLTAALTHLLEQGIREHPEQWLWSYKRWKYCPHDGDRSRYPHYARKLTPDGA